MFSESTDVVKAHVDANKPFIMISMIEDENSPNGYVPDQMYSNMVKDDSEIDMAIQVLADTMIRLAFSQLTDALLKVSSELLRVGYELQSEYLRKKSEE